MTTWDVFSAARFTVWATAKQALALARSFASVSWEMVTGDD